MKLFQGALENKKVWDVFENFKILLFQYVPK